MFLLQRAPHRFAQDAAYAIVATAAHTLCVMLILHLQTQGAVHHDLQAILFNTLTRPLDGRTHQQPCKQQKGAQAKRSKRAACHA